MKRTLVLICAMVLVAGLSFAQETSQADVFGGYSYLRVDGLNTNGWNAALTGNITKNFGITADFNGTYKSVGSVDSNRHSFLFGPQVAYPTGKVKPFAHVLFGADRASVGSLSDTSYGLALGGGVDVKVSKLFSIRLGQADYLRSGHGDGQNDFRFSTGVVFNLGSK